MVTAGLLDTSRLVLEPLRIEHAQEMAPVLGDPELYTFTGGEPATVQQLRDQYARQAVGRSADGTEGWLNWIIRTRDGSVAVGYVQATVTAETSGTAADVAWVIGTGAQGRGFAAEAASAMVQWLLAQDVDVITAHVHPDHHSSAAVARRVGFSPTPRIEDGEVRWMLNR